VEEQLAATQEIARNVAEAAVGTGQVTGSLDGMTQAAASTGSAAGQALTVADGLAVDSGLLDQEVGIFLDKIRAA
jgi:methyl-accepting chemotaxis protein